VWCEFGAGMVASGSRARRFDYSTRTASNFCE
jgi:hypothetical protein